jgi:hypothetical protein
VGLFDKIKHFAGGHGVKASITRVERQSPGSVSFPFTDSVMKFNIEVTGDKEVTILNHRFEVWVERTEEENERIIEVAGESHDESTDIIGGDVKWPYELAPGQVIKDGCCILDVDLGATLRKIGVDDPTTAIDDPNYRFFVKFIADVKGSPMDAEAECDFTPTA